MLPRSAAALAIEGFDDSDWSRLDELRELFLDTGAGLRGDYWRAPRDLEIYDATLGERIRWKWNAVLDELDALGFAAPRGLVVDYGCGSGVATRAWLAQHTSSAERVLLLDRSPLARAHARASLAAQHPGLAVEEASEWPAGLEADVLLASHVLPELHGEGLESLLEAMGAARCVAWVEPGERATARKLSAQRERLRATHRALAPCPHDAACGALAPGRERDWCHFQGAPPPEVHTNASWRAFGQSLGIDLRALPYAYLVLARRGEPARELPAGLARLLGRPRIEKGRALLQLCREGGLADLQYLQRLDKALFRELMDAAGRRWLLELAAEGTRIQALRRAETRPPS